MTRLNPSLSDRIQISEKSSEDTVREFGVVFREIHRNYWYALRICVLVVIYFFRCEKCGNCCRYSPPVFKEKEVIEIAKYLDKDISDLPLKPFIQYFKVFYRAEKPCPFLDHDNNCIIYPVRGTVCRAFPHEWLMYSMVPSYCPGVIKALKKATRFIMANKKILKEAVSIMEDDLVLLAKSSAYKERMRHLEYRPLVEKLFQFINNRKEKNHDSY